MEAEKIIVFFLLQALQQEELGQDEAAMMEFENERLLEHLSSLNNQVDQVQSKVVKIAELQNIFTEKVLQQADTVEL